LQVNASLIDELLTLRKEEKRALVQPPQPEVKSNDKGKLTGICDIYRP